MTIDSILSRWNMRLAYEQVVSKGGAPGVDGLHVDELYGYLQTHWASHKSELLSGRYRPNPVKRVLIPKPNGGERQLGIPTVFDRMVQQGISQKLSELYEATFSENSYGFRPGRSARQALDTALGYLNSGYEYLVEIDLAQFFDHVNHDRLMHKLSERISDKAVLRLIRSYLQSGIMYGGVVSRSLEGMPQGGNLSPLLSNIVLDELDKELENRGHGFVRYADDISIFVKSRRAGERVLSSLTNWIEQRLKLPVNRDKSGVRHYCKGGLLGFGFYKDGAGIQSRILPKSYHRFRSKLKSRTSRSWSISMAERLKRINQLSTGWLSYFGKAKGKGRISAIDEWLRHRLRMCIWKQWKRVRTRMRSLIKLGIPKWQAYQWANTRKGYWHTASSPIMQCAITTARLKQKGYKALSEIYTRKHLILMNRRDTRPVCQVV